MSGNKPLASAWAARRPMGAWFHRPVAVEMDARNRQRIRSGCWPKQIPTNSPSSCDYHRRPPHSAHWIAGWPSKNNLLCKRRTLRMRILQLSCDFGSSPPLLARARNKQGRAFRLFLPFFVGLKTTGMEDSAEPEGLPNTAQVGTVVWITCASFQRALYMQKVLGGDRGEGSERPRVDLQSLNTRAYLDHTVVPILLDAMAAVAKER